MSPIMSNSVTVRLSVTLMNTKSFMGKQRTLVPECHYPMKCLFIMFAICYKGKELLLTD